MPVDNEDPRHYLSARRMGSGFYKKITQAIIENSSLGGYYEI
jgi:hypothetical protein